MNRLIHLFKKLNYPMPFGHWIIDLILAIPRIICGLLLSFFYGADKFGMPWTAEDRNLDLFEVIYWFPQDVESFGGVFAMFPVFFAWMGAFSEAVGGLLMALGFQTRIAGFLIVCTMLVAIFCQQWNSGLWGMSAALGFLWVGIYAMVLGSGRFGLDYLISKKWKS